MRLRRRLLALGLACGAVAALAACSSTGSDSSGRSGPLQPTPALEIAPSPAAIAALPASPAPAQAATVVPSPTATPRPAPVPSPIRLRRTPEPPTPTATPAPAAKSSPLASSLAIRPFGIPDPPRRDPIDLARRLTPDRYRAYLDRTDSTSEPIRVGDEQIFNVLLDEGAVQVTAVAQRVSEHAYWFFDDRFPRASEDIDRAVERFESEVWPSVTGLFGEVDTGKPDDPRIVILHTPLGQGIGGYFSGADAFPREFLKFSNEQVMINVSATLRPGTDRYSGVLAHELQHAVNFTQDRGDETWLNEGLSELAATRAGFPAPSFRSYLAAPDTQLNSWPAEGDPASSYGAGLLFSEYLTDRYGGEGTISTLVAQQADGLASVETYLEAVGSESGAIDVFRDWTVANLLDEDGTAYGYPNRTLGRVSRRIAIEPTEYRDAVNQFGADYWVVTVDDDQKVRLSFEGDSTTRLIPTAPHSGNSCWWGNSGDSIDTTLTRTIDLGGVDAATLNFAAWYDTEEEWDFAYVEVSVDGGETWTLLPGRFTTSNNPNGTGYGNGLTGASNGWVQESMDLAPYAGAEILLRFEYVTDDALNIHGICVDDIEIPEIGFSDDAESDTGWVSDGFARIDPEVPQEWLVTVVRRRQDRPASVDSVEIAGGSGEAIIEPIPQDEDVFLIVSAVTPITITPSDYRLVFDVVE